MKAGVIGLGSMGANHARVYSDLPGVDLVAVADPRPEALEAATRNRKTHAYTDYVDMLEREAIDICSVVVPTTLHYAVGLDLVQRGIHTLIEKPIAATLEEARRLASAAEEAHVVLSVGHIERFNPVVQELMERIHAGMIGHIYHVHTRRLGPLPPRIKDVGVAVDLATHDLDLMRLLLAPAELQSVFASAITPPPAVHEEQLSALLQFSGATTGLLEVSWLTPAKIREIWVYGERGTYRAELVDQDLFHYDNPMAAYDPSDGHSFGEGSITKVYIRRDEPLAAEIRAFLRAVRGDGPIPVPAADAMWALAASRWLQQSAAQHALVLCADTRTAALHVN